MNKKMKTTYRREDDFQWIANRILSEFNKYYGKMEWHKIAAQKIYGVIYGKEPKFNPKKVSMERLFKDCDQPMEQPKRSFQGWTPYFAIAIALVWILVMVIYF